jgi:hypothetical protein
VAEDSEAELEFREKNNLGLWQWKYTGKRQ